jgi:hypothetical protein
MNPTHAAAWFSPVFAATGQPISPGRWAQAVLDLAPDDRAYLVGRRKQALRTNLRRARQQGVHVKALATYDEWFLTASEALRYRSWGPQVIGRMTPPADGQDMGYFIATDHEGRLVAISMVAIFNDCAVLLCLLSVPHHPAASSSRYLLHTGMRSDLRARGVRHLIVGSPLKESPGLQYFQHLLGYEMRNLDITVLDHADLQARSKSTLGRLHDAHERVRAANFSG